MWMLLRTIYVPKLTSTCISCLSSDFNKVGSTAYNGFCFILSTTLNQPHVTFAISYTPLTNSDGT
jgi:hypothetical protein